MIFAYLLAITGLTLSAVAIYYSVIGLTAIFAAAFWSIVVMGATLEIAKLVAASWLKMYWGQIPRGIKIYMTTAVVILMLITSMGIFGFLSKAHLDQNIVSGDVQSRISLIDEKIKIERENIANAQQVIKQMDAAVNGIIATGDQEIKLRDGTTRIQSAAERSLQIRRSQANDRAALTKQIEEAQTRIVKLQEESAPIRSEMREVEAKVGPIKYIAALIYGDNPDTNVLEKAVTWVIMIIVLVFDPLAVLLILGAQMTWQWRKDQEERENELVEETVAHTHTEENSESVSGDSSSGGEGEFRQDKESSADDDVRKQEIQEIVGHELPPTEQFDLEAHARKHVPTDSDIVDDLGLEEWNRMLEQAEKAVDEEKERMRHWKEDHPESTIKGEKLKKEIGIIQRLPWEDESLRTRPDFTEVIEPDSKKKSPT
jgi:hypothetical protein